MKINSGILFLMDRIYYMSKKANISINIMMILNNSKAQKI